ncbi:MAG: zinc-binding dehydrogenase [Bacillota bacterium]|jgi:L-iditol 2-dehydrogenase
MKAAFLEGPGKISVRTVPDPKCPPGGLLTKVEGCAICGSDLRSWESGTRHVGEIIGHETVATVIEVGEGVTDFKPGDRITDVPATCGVCEFCRRGIQNLCRHRGRIDGPTQGGFAELRPLGRAVLSGGFVLRVPNDLSLEAAVTIEPLACVLNGHEKMDIWFDTSVAIIGAGPIGAMHAAVARLRGARKIVVVDLLEKRLQMALPFGADHLVDSSVNDPVKAVLDLTEGRGVDLVIVACVSASAQKQALQMAARNGQVLLFAGLPAEASEVTLDTNLIHYNEITVVGARSSVQRQWELALELIKGGKIDASKIVTHYVGLDEIEDGFRLARSGDAMKVAVVPGL